MYIMSAEGSRDGSLMYLGPYSYKLVTTSPHKWVQSLGGTKQTFGFTLELGLLL